MKKYKAKEKLLPKVTKEAFNKMSKPRRLLALAKDVLAQLEIDAYEPATGWWIQFQFYRHDNEQVETLRKRMEDFDRMAKVNDLQSLFLSGNQAKYATSCQACALGASLISYARICDDVKVKKSGETADISDLVKKVSNDLLLVEVAFERGLGYVRLIDNKFNFDQFDSDYNCYVPAEWPTEFEVSNYDAHRAAMTFGNMFSEKKELLTAIMNNIIKNKGHFKPWLDTRCSIFVK